MKTSSLHFCNKRGLYPTSVLAENRFPIFALRLRIRLAGARRWENTFLTSFLRWQDKSMGLLWTKTGSKILESNVTVIPPPGGPADINQFYQLTFWQHCLKGGHSSFWQGVCLKNSIQCLNDDLRWHRKSKFMLCAIYILFSLKEKRDTWNHLMEYLCMANSSVGHQWASKAAVDYGYYYYI